MRDKTADFSVVSPDFLSASPFTHVKTHIVIEIEMLICIYTHIFTHFICPLACMNDDFLVEASFQFCLLWNEMLPVESGQI